MGSACGQPAIGESDAITTEMPIFILSGIRYGLGVSAENSEEPLSWVWPILESGSATAGTQRPAEDRPPCHGRAVSASSLLHRGVLESVRESLIGRLQTVACWAYELENGLVSGGLCDGV